jgi:hypothetical protein
MIVSLLKQLPAAFGKFLTYHLRRMTGSAQASAAPVSGPVIPPADADFHIGLAEPFAANVTWHAHDQPDESDELRQTALYQLWLTIPDGNKWSQYFWIYERVFASLRHEKLKILEIGVLRGSSLRLWREYFDDPETVIVGLDIDPKCAQYAKPDRGVHVMIGNQVDRAFLADVVSRHGPFDIIIDDGSHISSQIIATFNALFLDGLKESGLYVVEDLHTSYWPGWRNSELSFIDVAKQIVELMHSHYRRAPELGAFWKGFPGRALTLDVPLMTTKVREVRFFDSIVVIDKVSLAHPPHVIFMSKQADAKDPAP